MPASKTGWIVRHQGVLPYAVVDEGGVTVEEERRRMLVECPKHHFLFVRTNVDASVLIAAGGDGSVSVACPSCEREYGLDLRVPE